jgi:hypothetical protein
MSASRQEQDVVQAQIEAASAEESATPRNTAVSQLEQLAVQSNLQILSPGEQKQGHIAIEILVRLDGLEMGKGAFFRAKQRIKYVMQYFGS